MLLVGAALLVHWVLFRCDCDAIHGATTGTAGRCPRRSTVTAGFLFLLSQSLGGSRLTTPEHSVGFNGNDPQI